MYIKVCAHCGEQFEADFEPISFCSTDCYIANYEKVERRKHPRKCKRPIRKRKHGACICYGPFGKEVTFYSDKSIEIAAKFNWDLPF